MLTNNKNIIANTVIEKAPDYELATSGIIKNGIDYAKLLNNYSPGLTERKKPKIYLFVEKYNSVKRNIELNEVLGKNIGNKYIDKIIIFTSEPVTDEIKNNKIDKIEILEFPNIKRFTYHDVFLIMNSFNEDIIKVFANSDIYFDESIKYLKLVNLELHCIALTRWDVNKHGSSEFRARRDSQDVWIFKNKINDYLLNNSNFNFGVPGCDNKIAYIIKHCGYNITNPALSIKAYHLHLNNEITYTDKDRLQKPFYLLDWGLLPEAFVYERLNIKPSNVLVHLSVNNCEQTELCNMLKKVTGNYVNIEYKKIESFDNTILAELIIHRPKIIFAQIQRPNILNSNILKLFFIINPKMKFINWTGDVRGGVPEWFKINANAVEGFDYHTCFSNCDDVKEMLSGGYKSEYIQVGYEHCYFNKNGIIKNSPPIVFFGNHHDRMFPLSNFRLEIVKKLKEKYGNLFGLYGTGWNKLADGNYNKNNKGEAEIYRGCKLAIGMNHFQINRYSSDRIYRAMGSGACYLTHNIPSLVKEGFINKVHLFKWNNFGDLSFLIDLLLGDDKQRLTVADAGNKLVEKHHRWINRLPIIQEILGVD